MSFSYLIVLYITSNAISIVGQFIAKFWVMLGFVLFFSIFALSAQATTLSRDLSTYNQALVLTDCADYSCLKTIVQGVRDENQLVSIVFPQYNSFIALIQPEKETTLKSKFSKISSISFDSVSESKISSMSQNQKFSSTIWNNLKASSVKEDSTANDFQFNDSLIMPEIVREQDATQSMVVGGTQTNWASNSIYTSEYMIGDVTVAVLMPESNASSPNTENWTTQEVTDVTTEVTDGLNWWITQYNLRNFNSNLHLTWNILVYDPFTYSQMSIPYEPIAMSISNQDIPVDAVMANFGYTGSTTGRAREYAFLNNLRNTYTSDWAFNIWAVDSTNGGGFSGGGSANAFLGGPRWQASATYASLLPNVNITTSHETGHIFWALDQYQSACQPFGCAYKTGYLNVENQNCDATPVCATDVASVMRAGISGIDQYGSWQLGWKDSDVDGIPDVVDYTSTGPGVSLNVYTPDPTTNKTLAYSGSGSVGPAVDNQNPFYSGAGQDILISSVKVSNAQYKVDSGSWSNASPSDGLFDSQSESCNFTTQPLSNGTHNVYLKTIDSLNQETITPAVDQITIKGAIGELCSLNTDCLSNICHPDVVGAKFCVSSANNCAVSGSEVVSGVGFSRSVVNRNDTAQICYLGYWGEDPLLASPASTSKMVAVEGGQITNASVTIQVPKLAPITNASMFVSAMSQSPMLNVNIDIGNDGSIEKTITSLSESDSPQLSNFSNSLNDYLQTCTAIKGICTISIGVKSDTAGTILLHGLDVQYNKFLPVQGQGGSGGGFMSSYSYVKDVVIGSTHSAIDTDYTYFVSLDTASLILQGKMKTNCDDLRVFDTVSQTELDRDIQNCNTVSTSVSWKASQALGLNIADSVTYDLYYGNALVGNDKRNLLNVYKLFDDFGDGVVSNNFSCSFSTSESGGVWSISTSGSSGNDCVSAFDSMNLVNPVKVEVSARLGSTMMGYPLYLGNNRALPIFSDSKMLAFQVYRNQSNRWYNVYKKNGGSLYESCASSPCLSQSANASFNTFSIDWQPQTIGNSLFYINGVLENNVSNSNPDSSTDLFLKFGSNYSGFDGQPSTLEIDYLKITHYVEIIPAMSLGNEGFNVPPNNAPVMETIPDITWIAQDRVSGPLQLMFGATDIDGQSLTYSNSYNLSTSFSSTDWSTWNSSFTPMTWSGVPWNVWTYNNLISSSNADAGLYYIVARVSDGTAIVGQIIEINLLPNNSRPSPTGSLLKCWIDTSGKCKNNIG